MRRCDSTPDSSCSRPFSCQQSCWRRGEAACFFLFEYPIAVIDAHRELDEAGGLSNQTTYAYRLDARGNWVHRTMTRGTPAAHRRRDGRNRRTRDRLRRLTEPDLQHRATKVDLATRLRAPALRVVRDNQVAASDAHLEVRRPLWPDT
jgi:hypothetical protein